MPHMRFLFIAVSISTLGCGLPLAPGTGGGDSGMPPIVEPPPDDPPLLAPFEGAWESEHRIEALRFSPDGARISAVLAGDDFLPRLSALDLESAAWTVVLEAHPDAQLIDPSWSADGARIEYCQDPRVFSLAALERGLFRVGADGGEAELVYEVADELTSCDRAPDGAFSFITQGDSPTLADLATGIESALSSAGEYTHVRLSPDGSHVTYTRNPLVLGDPAPVYVYDVGAATETLVSETDSDVHWLDDDHLVVEGAAGLVVFALSNPTTTTQTIETGGALDAFAVDPTRGAVGYVLTSSSREVVVTALQGVVGAGT